ncbi:alkylation response protein AidB-like acyl-CoA dehydrogenase [Pseudomonas psychrotolerans]|nr:alkylation response protein AidB-like acyl-CoA dehydrogenase [Pseudomonas psychrotolerans]
MAEFDPRGPAAPGATLGDWLDERAEALDQGICDPEVLLPQLAEGGCFGQGVAPLLGGSGGTLGDAVEGIAWLAEHSLTAAFVCWGQRAFIEYLLQSPNGGLRDRLLPRLLSGDLAGATGLSNAMKFLSGLEQLQIEARRTEHGWRLTGCMPWVTNLRKSGFVVAGAVARAGEARPFVTALASQSAGLRRSSDLQLMGLQGSNTAALTLTDVELTEDWLLHDEARLYLPRVRPAFLGLQCGLAIGLARRSLAEAQRLEGEGRRALQAELDALGEALERAACGGCTKDWRTSASSSNQQSCSACASPWPNRPPRRCNWSCKPVAAAPICVSAARPSRGAGGRLPSCPSSPPA